MHTQCSREHVLRLPSATREELLTKEGIEDQQLLLHEKWSNNCSKADLPSNPPHVKNCTESWTAFESRKREQQVFFELHERLIEKENSRLEAAKKAQLARSKTVIDKMMAYERDRLKKQAPPQHTLFIDFRKLQHQVFTHQRDALEKAEGMLREKLCEVETELLFSIVMMWHAESEIQDVRLRESTIAEQALQQQRKMEEQQRAEEEKRREAERIENERRNAEEEKERAEAEKRLERKRREEERRAKAKLAREQRMSRDNLSES
jgi:hypothetical protein